MNKTAGKIILQDKDRMFVPGENPGVCLKRIQRIKKINTKAKLIQILIRVINYFFAFNSSSSLIT